MSFRLYLSLLFVFAFSVAWCEDAPHRWVNPLIGTGASGHTYPGPTLPFGLVQPSPVSGAVGWGYCSEYRHDDARLFGFTQTHLSGTGCMDLGDLLLMPVDGGRVVEPDSFLHAPCPQALHPLGSRKGREVAEVGYYGVQLPEVPVWSEVTATQRVAFYRHEFGKAVAQPALYMDLQHGPAWSWAQYDRHVVEASWALADSVTFVGHRRSRVWVDQDVYFVVRFSQPVQQVDQYPFRPGNVGRRLLLRFAPLGGAALSVKVALSTVSVDNAWENLCRELPSWDFAATRRAAERAWDELLGRVCVEGTPEQRTQFYTALYHTLVQPNNLADTNGQYLDARRSVRTAPQGGMYSTFSLWDTFRAVHPLYHLIVPERVGPMISSLIEQGETQGYLPIWALWGREAQTMIGNHAVAVIAEAYAKGCRDFDVERAYALVHRTLTEDHGAKTRWSIYDRYGYYPYDLVRDESVSQTLEMCYDDYAAAQLARALGHEADARKFEHRSNAFRNLFDPSTGFMRPKDSRGVWRTPFDPDALAHAESRGGDYTEGNAWQYSWHVLHDVPGLIRLMGAGGASRASGRINVEELRGAPTVEECARFCARLDSFFLRPLSDSSLPDVSGLIGQYAHGNEPSHHVPYLYALAGQPRRTACVVNQISDTFYRATPDGLCGNDDCGQLSAWYIFACLGFYPLDPVSGTYVLGVPQLPRTTLHLPQGRTFTIVAEGLTPDRRHVHEIRLNGQALQRPFLTHTELMHGGELRFVMGE